MSSLTWCTRGTCGCNFQYVFFISNVELATRSLTATYFPDDVMADSRPLFNLIIMYDGSVKALAYAAGCLSECLESR